MARKESDIRVFCYSEWPWINSDDDTSTWPSGGPLKAPKLYILKGVVGLYNTNKLNKNELPSTYANDKIQRVSFLFRKFRPGTELVNEEYLIIQTTTCVVAVSLLDPEFF